ncbi:MAG: hypothetical protein GQ534_04500 [Candidatus Delongbacteria bacterium]|nr:hypothetical protein [Candidatus Delongbacteria bacterium]
MKKIRLINYNSKRNKELYLNEISEIAGVFSRDDNEFQTLSLKKDCDQEEMLNELVKFMELKARKRNFIKIFIYASTAYTKVLEKLGFIKRKVFFDNEDHKYFKMFKVI